MVDDDKNSLNDEYEFSDLDVIGPDPETERTTVETTTVREEANRGIITRILILIFVIILGFLVYKYLGPFFTKKRTKDTVPAVTQGSNVNSTITPIGSSNTVPSQPPETTAPSEVVTPVVSNPTPVQSVTQGPDLTDLTQRISTLESNQQNLQSEIDSINNQLGNMNNNITALANKISELNQNLVAITTKIELQADQIAILTVKTKPAVVKKVVIRTPPPPVYFIQAVIPGRAWLISQNGSTISVREGTRIAGYGIIRLIDSRQGKIITSSGRIIRFNQQDS